MGAVKSQHQVIARKYRPLTFEDVVGQEAIARTLVNAISSGRIAHAYMFCGPRGVGKTSTARILARALNCLSADAPTVAPCGTCDLCLRATQGEDLDVLEIDAASNRKVDDARNLIANVSFHPSRARFKVYIVDEVHMLTTEAFNALLKTLEEPPPHVKFVFATTDPQKVPATILSRCQRFDFRPVPPAEIAALLGRICASEGLEAEDAALLAIARASVGGLRDAESLLEQLATLGAGAVRLDDLHALLGTVPGERMRLLFDAVVRGDVGGALGACADILDAGTDPGELLRQSMQHARDLMLVRCAGPRAADVAADPATRAELVEQAGAFSDATLVYAVTLLTEALKTARLLGEGRLVAETTFARLAGQGEMRFLDSLVRDLGRLERRLAEGGAAPGDATAMGSTRGGGAQGGASPAPGNHTSPSRSAHDARGDGASRTPGPRRESGRSAQPPTSAARDDHGQERDRPRALAAKAPTPSPMPSQGDGKSRGSAQEPTQAWDHAASSAIALDDGPEVYADALLDRPWDDAHETIDVDETRTPVTPAAPVGSAPVEADDSGDALFDDDQAPPPVVDVHEPVGAAALASRWPEVLECARGSSLLRTALAAVRVERVEQDAVVLSVPTGFPFLANALADAATSRRLDEIIERFAGRRLMVRTAEREPDPEPEEEEGTGRSAAELQMQRLSAADVDAIRQAPITKLIETELSGRIVHMERHA